MRKILLLGLLLTTLFSNPSFGQVDYPVSGLIGYYPFNQNTFDAFAPFRNPSFSQATLTADRNGAPNSAYQFSKVNQDKIEIDLVQFPQFKSNQFTIAFWVKTSAPSFFNGGDEPTVVSLGQSTRVGFRRSVNGLNHFARYQNSVGPVDGEWWFSEVNPTEWHHVLITGSDQGINFYVDGNEPPITPGVFGQPVTYNATDLTFTFGVNALLDANSYFDGAIDDIFIYNRVVSAAERLQIKNHYTTTPAPAPINIISGLPADTLACSSQMVLSVEAESEQPLTYAWLGPNGQFLSNNLKYSGVNTPNLTINQFGAADNGAYICQISNAPNNILAVFSEVTRAIPVQFNNLIDLNNNLIINPTFCSGTNFQATFQGSASADQLQWFKDGEPFGSPNQAFIFLNNLNGSQDGTYNLHGTNQCGTVISPDLVVQTQFAPQITVQPTFDAVFCQFSDFSATLEFEGNFITNIQWRRNGFDIPGANDFSLTINQPGAYRAFVSGACGATIATTELVIQGFFPNITQQPTAVSACPGDAAFFSISVANDIDLPVNYQWLFNGSIIDGANASTFEIASVQPENFGAYTCQIEQNGCTRTSSAAILNAASEALLSANRGYYPVRNNSVNNVSTVNSTAPEIFGLDYGTDGFGVDGSAFKIGTAPNSYFRNLPGVGNASISAWIKYDGPSFALYQTIFSQGFNNSNVLLAVANDGRLIWGNNAQGNFNNYPGTPTLPENEWVHVAITRDGAGIQLYLNGDQLVDADIAPKGFIGDYLGSIFNLPNVRFNGWFDEVRFFNRKLTEDEVQTIYKAPIISSNIEFETSTACAPFTGAFNIPVNSFSPDDLFLQWFKNGEPIPGETSSLLNLENIGAAEAGTYTLTATSGCLSSTIEVAELTLNDAPSITSISNDVETCLGEPFTLLAEVSGQDFTVQWFKDGVAIDGAESTEFTITNAGISNGGNYTIQVQSDCGTVTSENINVVVELWPIIAENSASTFVCEGGELELFATVINTDNVSFQWQKNGVDIPGANGSTYTITNASAADASGYRVIAFNDCGSSQSDLINVAINPPYVFLLQPQGATLCEGDSYQFTAQLNQLSNLDPEQSFTWLKDGEPVPGIIQFQPTFESVTPDLSGEWVLQINTLYCGAIQSEPAILTINEIPVVSVEPISAICEGQSVTLTASGAETYSWTEGVENGVAFTPTQTGEYTVVGTANGCDSELVTISVTVNPKPVVTVEAIEPICLGESITLTASGADSFAWDNNVDNGVAFTPTTSGNYTVIGTTNGCESEPVVVSVVVNEIPTLEISAPEGICGAGEVIVSATSNGTISFPDGYDNGFAIFITETLTQEISANIGNCVVTEIVTVEVNQEPSLQISGLSQVCSGTEVVLTATGANIISWSDGIENGVPFTPTETSTYTVTGTNLGCPEQTLNYTVTVIERPSITVEPFEPVCLGESITLTASGANAHFWDGGIENGVSFVPTATSTFTVFGNSNGCDSEPVTVTVIVNELPEPVISYDTNTESLITGEFESYQWLFEDVLIEGAINQSYQTIVEGVYTVLVSDENCEGLSEEFTLSTVGVATIGSPFSFNLFPNPASEQVTISFNGNLTQQVELHIFDLTGKMVGSKRITQTVQPIKVDNLAEGIYLFRMVSNDFATTQRVVIKK
jgi:hypothetical protein